MGTPSVYSHVTTRSSANLKSSRSMRSIRLPWYQKPILQDAIVLDIQRGALVTGFYSLVSWYDEQYMKWSEKYVYLPCCASLDLLTSVGILPLG
jgi:hypothetical protein